MMKWFSFGFFLLAALAVPCAAMSVIAPSFPKLVQSAEQIVRAKATGITSQWDSAPPGRMIHTYVQFQVLKTLKGDAQNTLTLRLLGGEVGDTGMAIPGMPTFAVGQTYILFVAQNGQAFCPLVGIGHGSYRIARDETTGTERVLRSSGDPLSSVAAVAEPFDAPRLKQESTPPGMDKDEFENAILDEISHPGQE